MKEAIGIIVGLILIIGGPIFFFGVLSEDEQKGRTEPVMEIKIEDPVFKDTEIQKTVTDLELKKLQGYLFQRDSQSRIYYPYYIGISPKGAEAVRKLFPEAKEILMDRNPRSVAVLKRSGVADPKAVYLGKKTKDWEIQFCGDAVIISFLPESTNVFLDQMQMQHFLGRYFD